MVQQIGRRILQSNDLQSKKAVMNEEQLEYKFIKEIFDKRRLSSDFHKTSDGTVLIGEQKSCDSSDVCIFDRCIYDKITYHSKLYTRSKKTINYYVQLNDKRIV